MPLCLVPNERERGLVGLNRSEICIELWQGTLHIKNSSAVHVAYSGFRHRFSLSLVFSVVELHVYWSYYWLKMASHDAKPICEINSWQMTCLFLESCFLSRKNSKMIQSSFMLPNSCRWGNMESSDCKKEVLMGEVERLLLSYSKYR